ncbi:hybrid sensor histidine kinase/response regulator transcription factor [Flavicella sediminum]|uniref:hybrid sensor histidine kinase/response regulator transcription factor n=1 Tax=Flavicella sediminum TaxID=2585141 RepID=UPI001121CE10|nr:hybrid sensor histidine kinase/response regulator transcription factor [Flavicella sediminum]
MFRKYRFVLFCFLFLVTLLNAQEGRLEYSHNLTISDGLAHNGVTSIFEDSKGYIWIGTYDGLNKYDGYEFKMYKNTLAVDILTSNRIRSITEDLKGNIWIGTDEGITVYNPSLEKFTKLYSDKFYNNRITGPIVKDIVIDKSQGFILCLTETQGVLIFDQEFSLLSHTKVPESVFNRQTKFANLIAIDEGLYLISGTGGLATFNVNSLAYERILQEEVNNTNSVTKVDSKTLLVTLRKGLIYINYKKEEDAISYKVKSKHFPKYYFKNAKVDPSGKLWLGLLNEGLFVLDDVYSLTDNSKLDIKKLQLTPGLLRISCFSFSERSGNWVGSFNKGVYRFDTQENPFHKYYPSKDAKLQLSSSSVSHLSTFDRNRIFISATKGSMSFYDTRKHEFEKMPLQITEEDRLNVSTVFVDSRKSIWLKILGKYEFLRARRKNKPFEKVVHPSFPDFGRIAPRTIKEDKYGNIWLGCEDEIYKISIDSSNNILQIEALSENPFFKDNKISLTRIVYPDPTFDFVWVGDDDDGLFRLKTKARTPLAEIEIDQYIHDKNNPLSISSNFVTSICRLPNDELWLGTERGGICKVLESDTEPKFVSFSEKNGLSNNVVKSIDYDNEYNLWVATNNGLNKFNTKEYTFRKFSKQDGLPFADFWYASDKLENGYIFLSGLDGFCYFRPEEVPNTEILPKLEFGDFKLFNKVVYPGDTLENRVLLKKHVEANDVLSLKHNENVFSIDVTSLHFSNPENYYLKYKLSPLEEDWIQVPSQQKTIQYNGLQPGSYELSVIASNSIGDWTEPVQLKILIKPPFWKTSLAFFLYVIFGGLIVYLVILIVLKIQTLNHNIEIEQLEIDNVKEVNAAKLRFFSNISHEIKTPLTLISGPVEVLLNQVKNNVEFKQKLQIVQRQSKKISQLIDQVHDFQRADANKLKMDYSNFCFDSYVTELLIDFNFLAQKDGKHLEVQGVDEKIYISADQDKLGKILNNLFSNAFKYTKAGDTIKLTYYTEEKELFVKVSDTGKGIERDDLPHIFERFYQSQKKHSAYTGGSGIGLAFSKRLVEMHYGYIDAESELDKGTIIHLRLPIVVDEDTVDQEEREKEILSYEKKYIEDPLIPHEVDLTKITFDENFLKAKVFFAEDNVDMRDFVAEMLSNFFEVTTFTNGQECLDALKEEWPDIIISDVLMPELNGFDLCKAVKSDIRTSHIPVVLLTACTSIEDQIKGIGDGADAYIQKPFNIQRLITRTESLLRNRKQLRERFKVDFPITLEKGVDKSKDNVFLEKLYDLMNENLDNQSLDINILAKKLYLNRTHFYQKVKELTNQTPFELLKEFRLKKAAEYLIQQKLPVNEVFVITGFKSRSHFSKLFKDKYKVTPGKYASEGMNSIINKEES